MFIPHVSRRDVERIVRREFPRDHVAALKILDQYDDPHTFDEAGRVRVQLAVLKLSCGDLTRLRENVDLANQDYRDVMGPAESARSWRIGIEVVDDMNEAQQEQLQKEDNSDYQAWLNRK